MHNGLYQALTQHYYNLQSERKACMEQINVLEAKYKAIDEQMVQVNDILCKHGKHIYEHFEEEERMAESESIPLDPNNNTLEWIGKNCKDCGNEKCKKLGALPKDYDCALWQPKVENYSIKTVTNAEEAENYTIRRIKK